MPASTTSSSTKILLIGAGELGTSFLPHLPTLPHVEITIGVRTPANYTHLASNGFSLLALDLTSDSQKLAEEFARYDILISATGFGQDPDSVKKLAYEALEAGKLKKSRGEDRLWFFPWQWGVDYDITGDGQGLMPLFGAQKVVRDLLRAEAEAANVKWTVVSTGIFMSFLFEPFWGIVDRSKEEDKGRVVVRALRNGQHKVTVTDVFDIGRVLTRIVAGDVDAENKVVYVAGDVVSYDELADIVEKVSGNEVEKEVWSVPHLEEELHEDPEDGLKKYRLVFARDGVWWDKERTVNEQLGMGMMHVEEYATELFRRSA
ncbi:NAD(P)-binding protein [Ophiobolus disseminans]|uniref:NAD(P)-binding protein n=1 Tax=Ophiobolus disseminans TaxID=1469910 RepID=A0A6A7ACR3_9PLEO|nr:NAD(P)-binding protein [Ophiobolus disseminans]